MDEATTCELLTKPFIALEAMEGHSIIENTRVYIDNHEIFDVSVGWLEWKINGCEK